MPAVTIAEGMTKLTSVIGNVTTLGSDIQDSVQPLALYRQSYLTHVSGGRGLGTLFTAASRTVVSSEERLINLASYMSLAPQ